MQLSVTGDFSSGAQSWGGEESFCDSRGNGRGRRGGAGGGESAAVEVGEGGGAGRGGGTLLSCHLLQSPRRTNEPRVCVFSCCRQWNCDVQLLERYRQALETAVNLSVKHNLAPLPGRTLLVYLTDANANRLCPKSHSQGVNKKPTKQTN